MSIVSSHHLLINSGLRHLVTTCKYMNLDSKKLKLMSYVIVVCGFLMQLDWYLTQTSTVSVDTLP